jgi:hypothetical protein
MTRINRHVLWLAFASVSLVGWPSALGADRITDPTRSIKDINAKVAMIEKQISAKGLPHLDTQYEYDEATEVSPPSFKFFFSPEDDVLIACEVHVGHETWGHTFTYYFDSDGSPLKYREAVLGREDKPEPRAIIYDSKGGVLWKNVDEARLAPQEIVLLYKLLSKRSQAFVAY